MSKKTENPYEMLPGSEILAGGKTQAIVWREGDRVYKFEPNENKLTNAYLAGRLLNLPPNNLFVKPNKIDQQLFEMEYVKGRTIKEIANTNFLLALKLIKSTIEELEKLEIFSQRIETTSDWHFRMLSTVDKVFRMDFLGLKQRKQIVAAMETCRWASNTMCAGFYPKDLNLGNILVTDDGQIKIIDQLIHIGDPLVIFTKLYLGWGPWMDKPIVEQENIDEFLAYAQSHMIINEQELIKKCKEIFPNDDRLTARFYALMVMRSLRLLSDLESQPLFQNILKIILDDTDRLFGEMLKNVTIPNK